MKKQSQTYVKYFKEESDAYSWMKMKNKVQVKLTNLFVLVDGPEDNFAVVDLRTAQDLGTGYQWAV